LHHPFYAHSRWRERGEGRDGGRENQKYNKIEYTLLTAAQYIHRRSGKTSSMDATAHFKVAFQYLSNK
jgi:hypothetical protein